MKGRAGLGFDENSFADLQTRSELHEAKLNELDKRISRQEKQSKVIGDISLNVRELAVTMKSMLREQISQSERITRLERAPAARYEKLIFAFVSAVLGALLGVIVNII